jgi:hypothetical protein
MNSPLTIKINRSIVVDQVASFLYATKAIKESNNITNIQFGGINSDLVELKIFLKEGEVK